MIHCKKIESEYFEAVTSGRKTFEVRAEDGVPFTEGDLLALNEVIGGVHTGRSCLVEVTYVLRDCRFVKPGLAILGIRPCKAVKLSADPFIEQDRLFNVPIYEVVTT